MKRLFLLCFVMGSCLNGCSSRVVPSVEATIQRTDGVIAGDTSRKVSLAELMPYMRRATWTDGWRQWKTSVEVECSDGKKVRLERLAPMFRIDGIGGTFLIRDEDVADYEKVRAKLISGGSQ